MKKLLVLVFVVLGLNTLSQTKPDAANRGKPYYRIVFGKLIYEPGTPSAVPGQTQGAIPKIVTATVNNMGVLTLRPLANSVVKIKSGTYRGINILSPTHVKIEAKDVIIDGGSLDISDANDFEISGLSVINNSYRAVNIRGGCNDIYFHDMKFRNIGNSTISYEYNGIYDGTDKTASMN